MSLFSSIQIANNALRATSVGLQVVGQNISNANTPGYIREEVIFSAAPAAREGKLQLGLGVEVRSIVQKIDNFLEDRLRSAVSDTAGAQAEVEAYTQLESLIGELGDNDLSTSLNNFFNSIHDVLSEPTSDAVRNLATLRGRTLTEDFNRLSSRARQVRSALNDRVAGTADDINRLVEAVRTLNIRISQAEGGDNSRSDAVGLRDQRLQALEDLSKLIDIQVSEQSNGAVNVLHQGEFLISGGNSRTVVSTTESDRGLRAYYLEIADTRTRLNPLSGELAGLISARDEVLGGYLDQLDSLAGTLAFEFNRVFASGQGLRGYQSLTSTSAVTDAGVPLDAAGLSYSPVNGTFDVLVYDRKSQLTRTTRITVDLDGLGSDTTLNDLASQLNAVAGITAQTTATNRLELSSDSSQLEIAFAGDSSGILSALGLSTFFTGSTATDLGVNSAVLNDPGKFAASRTGVGADTATALDLADFLDRPLETRDGATLSDVYDRIVNGITQGAAVAKSVSDGFQVFEETLRGQKLAKSGVSLDEEAVRLIQFQRSFQANARVISTINELLGVLINL